MTLTVYGRDKADISPLKDKRIAVLGYGSQGRAHALNLRDSGLSVIVAQRPSSERFRLAVQDGFQPLKIPDAVRQADLIIFGLPDERMGEIFKAEVEANLHAGQALGFIHGFAIRFGLIEPPTGVDVIMIAPKGPGPLVRDTYARGDGIAAIMAIHQDATGHARDMALAWGGGIGSARRGLIEATFAQECETDLFGEQAVLTGGVLELMKAAFETLVRAGYPAELAYIECIHELKQIVDMQYVGGLEMVRSKISKTASYGGLTRGPRLINEQMRSTMREILEEIRSGAFAREWVFQSGGDGKRLDELIEAESREESEAAGRRIRNLQANA